MTNLITLTFMLFVYPWTVVERTYFRDGDWLIDLIVV